MSGEAVLSPAIILNVCATYCSESKTGFSNLRLCGGFEKKDKQSHGNVKRLSFLNSITVVGLKLFLLFKIAKPNGICFASCDFLN